MSLLPVCVAKTKFNISGNQRSSCDEREYQGYSMERICS